MSALLTDLDDLVPEHDCAFTLRVHTLIPGEFSSYACERCVEIVKAVALKHLPTATDVVVSPMTRPSPTTKES